MGAINIYITQDGFSILGKGQTGKRIKFTRIAIGDGALKAGQTPQIMTSINNQIMSLEISKLKLNGDNTVTVGSVFSNADSKIAFSYRELGLYAEDPDTGKEKLYAYGNAGDNAEIIPAYGTSTLVEKIIDIIVIIDNARDVTANISPTIGVSREEFEEHKEDNIKELQSKASLYHAHTGLDGTARINYNDIENTPVFPIDDIYKAINSIKPDTVFIPKLTDLPLGASLFDDYTLSDLQRSGIGTLNSLPYNQIIFKQKKYFIMQNGKCGRIDVVTKEFEVFDAPPIASYLATLVSSYSDGNLYLFTNNSSDNVLYQLNTTTLKWTQKSSPPSDAFRSSSIYLYPYIVESSGYIYTINAALSPNVFCKYSIANNTWQQLSWSSANFKDKEFLNGSSPIGQVINGVWYILGRQKLYKITLSTGAVSEKNYPFTLGASGTGYGGVSIIGTNKLRIGIYDTNITPPTNYVYDYNTSTDSFTAVDLGRSIICWGLNGELINGDFYFVNYSSGLNFYSTKKLQTSYVKICRIYQNDTILPIGGDIKFLPNGLNTSSDEITLTAGQEWTATDGGNLISTSTTFPPATIYRDKLQ